MQYYCKVFIILLNIIKIGSILFQVFLDYEHCLLAMKQIGKFHALSYTTKQNDSKAFFKAASKIQEKWIREFISKDNKLYYLCAKRGIQPLIDEGISVKLLSSTLKEFEDCSNLFEKLLTPIEPEAVICHGDFNCNNVLFKYNEEMKPVGIKLIDVQTPRYASPVTDLSFFILMNTTHSLRKQHLNDLLREYKTSLLSSVAGSAIVPELDFGRTFIYGYFHCCFFLPEMIVRDYSQDCLIEDLDERAKKYAERGGEKVTQVLVDIIKDLLEFNLIKEIR